MTKFYIYIPWFLLLSGQLQHFQVFSIPDKSLVWTTGGRYLYYSPKAINWTNAHMTATEFWDTFLDLNFTAKSLYGISADTSRQHFILVDKGARAIYVYNTTHTTFFHMGTSPDIGQVAVDWRGRNVYWTDTGYGWIAMKKLPASLGTHDSTDHRFKVIIDKYLQQPTGIAVHPHKYYLFWADKGDSPQIERSDIVGKDRKVIVWQGLITPTTLCVDVTSDRLYWSDPGRGTIEYSNLNGDDRTILISEPNIHYYGIAKFQESLVYTVPSMKQIGYVSLRENIEGDHVKAILQFDRLTLYHVLAYDTALQPRKAFEGCDTNRSIIACEQMCYHGPQDQGLSCLCYDGYDLKLNQNCSVDGHILQRHILFTNFSQICAVPISVLGLGQNIQKDTLCDIVISDTRITRFSLDMTDKVVYFTDGTSIYKQEAFKTNKTLLYNTTGNIIDMDFDWKKQTLYWIQRDDRHIYYMVINTPNEIETTDFDIGHEATAIAVDPYNSSLFWIDKSPQSHYTLYKWKINTDTYSEIPVTLLSNPTDLEYDRIRQRLLWNDNKGYIGIINTNLTGETKRDIKSVTGQDRFAVAMYKNYILASSAENMHFDIIYELDPVPFEVTLANNYEREILDLHVYETALQPMDLEPCEKDNNGGCEHICIPDPDVLKCECVLGYKLNQDGKSCITEVLTSNYFVVLDILHGKVYQIDRTTQGVFTIEMDISSIPSALALDSSRNMVVWVDSKNGIVKKKTLGMADEKAVKTGIDETSAVAIDSSTGNIYVSTDDGIEVINDIKDSTVVIDTTKIKGTVGKIALHPQAGQMAWYEYGSETRIMVANMDGSKDETVSNDGQPDDLTFDLEDSDWLYWCDSGKDVISKSDLKSFTTTNVYQGRGLKPVAIDIKGSFVYVVPMNNRKIIRLNKETGQNQRVVLESPLFGTFSNFFIYQDNIKAHSLCGYCNGGCSNICLPSGENIRQCKCSDGINLENDRVTCEHATVCTEDTFNNIEGIKTLDDCCPSSMLHDNACKPTCLDGYYSSGQYIKCSAGKWNHTFKDMCKKKENPETSSPMAYIAAGVGGGVAAIVIIIVFVCIYKRKNMGDKGDRRRLEESSYTDSGMVRSPYASPDGARSPDPPPSVDDIQEEVYNSLDEAKMVDVSKLRVELPRRPHDKKEIEDKRSSIIDRYSRFPGYDGGYITPSNLDVSDDGYLAAKSVSGGSFQSSPSGETFHGSPSGETFHGNHSLQGHHFGESFQDHSWRPFHNHHEAGESLPTGRLNPPVDGSNHPNHFHRELDAGHSNGSFDHVEINHGNESRKLKTVRYTRDNSHRDRLPPPAHVDGFHDNHSQNYRSGSRPTHQWTA